MANCLVTTLTEAVDNADILAPDEFVIKINHIDEAITNAARWMSFVFRAAATVRMANASYSFADADGNSLGASVDFASNVTKTLYFPNPPAGSYYKVIVSNKYALGGMNTQEYPSTVYNFFEFNLDDLEYCTYLSSLRCMCHKVSGYISNLKRISNLDYLQITRTGVAGDLSDLASIPSLRYFKGAPSDVSGDIAVISQLPRLRNLETAGCLEVRGNMSAFANHTSINYVSLPQVAGHPSIEGDIANLSGCTSLGFFSATSESKIYGDIVAFANLDSLYTVNLNGTNVSGDVEAFAGKIKMQVINIGNTVSETFIGPADDKVDGDIASFASLPMLNTLNLQNTGVTGDASDLVDVPRLTNLYLTNTAIEGEIGDFNSTNMPNLVNLDLGNCAGISGSIAEWAFPPNIQNIQIYGTNITGDIGAALEDCTTLTAISFNNTDVSGDITKIYSGTAMLTGTAVGCAYLSGDLSQLPDDFYFFQASGRSSATFSWSADDARPSSSTIICFDNVDFGDDLENMLINQATCTPKGYTTMWNQRRMYVWGSGTSATGMSAECRAACEALGEAGYTVYINGVLVTDLTV